MSINAQVTSDLMDQINRDAWRAQDSIKWFRTLEGWTDPGERAALERVAAEMKDQPILDLGVGGGRTVPLLRRISQDYTALDYTPELLDACRKKYPDVRLVHGDARDLSRFPDGTFALVVFSFNGIDAVGPEGRTRILSEANRVLRRGGVFLFSTHNQSGPGHGERFKLGIHFTRNPFKLAVRLMRALIGSPRTIINYVRYSRLNQQGDGYSIMNAAAHNHGIVIQYVTLDKQLEQLRASGFGADVEAYSNHDGLRIRPGEAVGTQPWWFHLVARKP